MSYIQVEAEECIDYLGNQLGSADTSYLPVLLQQLLLVGQKFPGKNLHHLYMSERSFMFHDLFPLSLLEHFFLDEDEK